MVQIAKAQRKECSGGGGEGGEGEEGKGRGGEEGKGRGGELGRRGEGGVVSCVFDFAQGPRTRRKKVIG
jgi:hypothetical protein